MSELDLDQGDADSMQQTSMLNMIETKLRAENQVCF